MTLDRLVTRSARGVGRLVAFLYLVESALSVFGQIFVTSSVLVRGDAPATAANILANEPLVRAGIAAALVSAGLHLVTAVLFYYLLRPVDRGVAFLSTLLMTFSAAIQALAALLVASALMVLVGRGYGAFSAEQTQALALVVLDWNGLVYNLMLVTFGFWCAAVGYLIARSGFLPRPIGLGMVLAGLAYATYLYPPLATRLYPFNLALAAGELVLVLWLLTVGVNPERWRARHAAVLAGE
ncbi:MAG: DUF4386 domain-containing protein [Elusimicrobia bacterium]|nr:DUF4386 domain-containing protein [Elusimicrobiota bacterium]